MGRKDGERAEGIVVDTSYSSKPTSKRSPLNVNPARLGDDPLFRYGSGEGTGDFQLSYRRY